MIKLTYDDKSINLPELPNVWKASNFNIVWKMWIASGFSSLINISSSIKFTIKTEVSLIVKCNLYVMIGFS